MKRLIVALALGASLLAPRLAHARMVEQLKGRYQTKDGPSPWVLTDVTFISGPDLNTATASLAYSYISTYAVVFFTDHQAAVIRIQGDYCYGGALSDACVWGGSRYLSTLRGADKEGREWEFCAPENYSC